ncbi:MFS general substrate transporter [Wallemia mellicola]|nr:MFS general substrate transporter [Wallemia mellicola]
MTKDCSKLGDNDSNLNEAVDSKTAEAEYDRSILAEEKRVLRKIDLRILSLTALAYLLNLIDRTNLANAKIMNTDTDSSMVEQLDLHGNRYGNVITAFYCAFIVAEIPSNLIMKKMRPSLHISRIVVGYGIVTCCSAAVQSFEGLLISRFFLGIAQAGFYPGILYYFSLWYNDDERAFRFAFFVSFSSLSTAFSGLLATACSYLNGLGHPALAGFRWLFILEGIPTIILGVCIFFMLPDYPESAKFLTTDERTIATKRLGDSVVNNEEEFKMSSVWCVLKQWDFWFIAIMWMLLAHGTAAFFFFAPTIINDLDASFQGVKAQLLSVPPSILACLMTIACGFLSDRVKNRPLFIIIGVAFVTVGYLILAVDKNVLVGRMAAVFLIALANVAIIPVAAYRVSIQSMRGADSTAIGFASSATVAISNISGITAPLVFDSGMRFDYICYTIMSFFLTAGIQAMVCWFWYGPGVTTVNKQQSDKAADKEGNTC